LRLNSSNAAVGGDDARVVDMNIFVAAAPDGNNRAAFARAASPARPWHDVSKRTASHR